MKKLILYGKVEHNIEPSPSLAYKLKDYSRRVAKAIAGEFPGKGAKAANPLFFDEGEKLAKYLRYNDSGRSLHQSRSAGLMIAMCLFSGGRLGDLYRLKWRHLKVSLSFNNSIVISCDIVSKGDPFGEKCHRKTVFVNDKNKWLLNWLLEDSKGASSDDYVFPIYKNNKKLSDFMKGDHFRYQFHKGAEKLKFNKRITGHSARNALASTLALAGASDEQLKIHFNWKSDSTMPQAYKRNNLEKSQIGCAFLVEKITTSGDIIDIQKQISLEK